jgi:hypothetical protein
VINTYTCSPAEEQALGEIALPAKWLTSNALASIAEK